MLHVHRVRERGRVAKASPSPASHHAHERGRGRCSNQTSRCCTSWRDTSKHYTRYISIICVYRCINYNACMPYSPFDTCTCWFNAPCQILIIKLTNQMFMHVTKNYGVVWIVTMFALCCHITFCHTCHTCLTWVAQIVSHTLACLRESCHTFCVYDMWVHCS